MYIGFGNAVLQCVHFGIIEGSDIVESSEHYVLVRCVCSRQRECGVRELQTLHITL